MAYGKNALVTGSTSGIGKGVARALADYGCNIVLNGSRPADRAEEIRSELEDSFRVKALYQQADLRNYDEVVQMVENAAHDLGSIDILVNNAGIQHVSPVEEFPLDKWEAIIDLNLKAAFYTIKNIVPVMKKRNWGRIVNIASAHALVASPHKSAYVSAKHGIAGLTKTVALETAENGITCNAICPGYVKTPLVEGQIEDTAKSRGISQDQVVRDVMLHAQQTKQFTTIEDIGEMTVFLCSDAAKNITGSMLPMDGGWTAH
ncbi:MAG: 3-hydroxybutyrate dehydrogenase [Thermodesulfobacteriota bacterium]